MNATAVRVQLSLGSIGPMSMKTKPPSPSSEAILYTVGRKPTPCTTPRTRIARLSRSTVVPPASVGPRGAANRPIRRARIERLGLSGTGGREPACRAPHRDRGGTPIAGWLLSRKQLLPVHELALMESVVDQITGLIDARVALVRLEIGELAGVDVDALRFCFGVCTQDTPLAGAELDIRIVAGRARCRSCGTEQPTHSYVASCTCGSFDRAMVAGTELRLKEVEVL